MRHRLARHALPPLLAGTLLFLSACKGTSQESPPSSPAPETAAPTANIAAQPDPVEAAVATPSGASLPVCKVGDSRTMVMTWRATFDANNILSIAQQWVINTRMGVPPQFNLPNFKSAPAADAGKKK